ncbi:hypothetical protein AOLI_G00026390 [Acnodon oligacanthus]
MSHLPALSGATGNSHVREELVWADMETLSINSTFVSLAKDEGTLEASQGLLGLTEADRQKKVSKEIWNVNENVSCASSSG